MKKLILIGLLLASFNSYSQYLDNKPLSEYDVEWVYVRAETMKLLNWFDWIAQADMGQLGPKSKIKEDKYINGEDGKPYRFSSPAQIIMLFEELGYDYINSQNTESAFLILFKKIE